MRAFYADASALLRWLFAEPGPTAPFGSGTAVSSKLVVVETARAVERARLLGHLDDDAYAVKLKELDSVLRALLLVHVTNEILQSARASFGVHVRALDALHVATAQSVVAHAGPMEFWTHDQRQARAAVARGLEVRGVAP